MRIAGLMAKCTGVLLLAMLLGLGIGAARAEDSVKAKLVYSTDFSPANLPFFIAKSQDWFTKNGLNLEEEKLLGDSNSVRLIMTGGGDITQVGLITALDAVLGGAKLKVIGAWQPIVDYQIIAGKNVGTKL
jgi:ABC-type nitrate/sulfonate/bicarbonate transport system substrate-binding protein